MDRSSLGSDKAPSQDHVPVGHAAGEIHVRALIINPRLVPKFSLWVVNRPTLAKQLVGGVAEGFMNDEIVQHFPDDVGAMDGSPHRIVP